MMLLATPIHRLTWSSDVGPAGSSVTPPQPVLSDRSSPVELVVSVLDPLVGQSPSLMASSHVMSSASPPSATAATNCSHTASAPAAQVSTPVSKDNVPVPSG